MEVEVKKEIDEATKRSRSDPEIPLSEISADIYSVSYEPNIRSTLPVNPFKHVNIAQA